MKSITTEKAPAAVGPYSQAVVAGNLVFVSGQIPVDPATGNIPEDIVDQARQALTNLGEVLRASGSGLDKAVRVTVFITDISAFGKVNEAYAEFFKEPYPSRSCVEVSKLPKGVKIEIDAIGIIG